MISSNLKISGGVVLLTLVILVACLPFWNPGPEAKNKKAENKKANHLIHSKSPYLLQHAHNPVNWYSWGKEAFERAKKENKPIFLSIGYSTCHWCHVMEKESFEDKEVAKILNENFISIKVDREERPDVDGIYMEFCVAVTGSGGWPLTIGMTPDKKPFFAGTYFPKNSRFGRPGLMQILPQIAGYWKKNQKQLSESSERIAKALGKISRNSPGNKLGKKSLDKAYEQLSQNFDSTWGGFGHAPKFPSPHNLLFLLRYWKHTGEKKALVMVEKTLSEMRRGGIFDHIGFGFHRYSTDHQWLVPHFEKMLYDQAMVSIAYLEIFQATGKEQYKKTAEEIFSYVQRDMTHQGGAFYSAEDADSEGKEGKFYLWKEEEILKILGKEKGTIFIKVYNTSKEGNFEEEASHQKGGNNILHMKKSWKDLSSELKMDERILRKQMEEARQKLFLVREKRIHPHKDDKILTDWNGLMIAALAKGGGVTGNSKYTEAAKKAVHFILSTLRKPDGRLLHRYRDREAALDGYLDDYAFLIWGLLELYETTFDPQYLELALELQKHQNRYFWDKQGGSFFFTASDSEKLLARPKKVYDGAIPSGNSVALLNLLKLSRITGKTEWEKMAFRLGRAFSSRIRRSPASYAHFLSGVDFALGPTYEVVVVGPTDGKGTLRLLETLQSSFLPGKVVIFVPSEKKNSPITRLAPYAKGYSLLQGKAAVYVCQNYSCKLPTSDPEKMLELLGEK